MLFNELPFVGRVGLYLENFTQKSQYLWNCSCPICGDFSSTTNRKKKRFYIYRPGTANHLNAKCHKCGYSSSFGSLLKLKFPEMYKEFVVEQYKNSVSIHTPHANVKTVLKAVPSDRTVLLMDKNLNGLKACSKLLETHPVAKFLTARKIPREKWDLLFYVTKFKNYVNSVLPGKFENTENDHPRLIIPFYDEEGKMFAFQGRAFGKESPKYITIKLQDKEKIYGLERLDKTKKIYVVEGPIDSLFLPNSIAVSGSNFDCDTVSALKKKAVLIFDNEPRNKEICKLIKKHILRGYNICLLPSTIETKDINEHVKSGISPEELCDIIDENTFAGPEALARFSAWVKVNLG